MTVPESVYFFIATLRHTSGKLGHAIILVLMLNHRGGLGPESRAQERSYWCSLGAKYQDRVKEGGFGAVKLK